MQHVGRGGSKNATQVHTYLINILILNPCDKSTLLHKIITQKEKWVDEKNNRGRGKGGGGSN